MLEREREGLEVFDVATNAKSNNVVAPSVDLTGDELVVVHNSKAFFAEGRNQLLPKR